jgi:hypothetical protein
MATSFVIWIGAILTLGAFSYLFKENEFYKGIEHLYVGCAAGYTVAMGWFNIVSKVWQPVSTKGQWWVIIPAALGIMLFSGSAGAEWRYLRRYPIAFITGTGAGLTIRTAVEQQFIVQIRSTVLALNSIDNFIIVFGVMAVVAYFFFTFKPNAVLGVGAGAGKWVIMVTFGAAFGNAIQGRISLLIGRIAFIFGEWIHLIK